MVACGLGRLQLEDGAVTIPPLCDHFTMESAVHCPLVRLPSPTVVTSARLVGRLTVPWTTGSGGPGYGAAVPQSLWNLS
jgi:hypothetical protein